MSHDKTVEKMARALYPFAGEFHKNIVRAHLSELSPGDTFVGAGGVECVVVPMVSTVEMETAGYMKMLEVGKRETGQIYQAMLAALTQKENEG